MSNRSLQRLAPALLALFACDAGHDAARPNIVLVSIDSLRHDHLGCYGYPHATSPRIDALARSGARFECAVSTSSWTLPAHAALFTGLFDSTHGLVDNGLRLAPEHKTLAEELKARGYHTAGFFGGPYLHPVFGLGDGFDVYQSCMTTIADDLSDDALRNESRAREGKSHDDVTGPRTLAEITKWAASRPSDRPFFLFVHLWDVHYDFIPPPQYAEMFDADYTGSLTGVDFMSNDAVNAGMAARDKQHLLALYDGEIRFTDDNLGLLLDGLEQRGMLADTLVVVTADHGEEFFEHDLKGHQKTLYDEVVRIPLVAHWPGHIAPGTVIADQVRIVDVMPTLLEAAGWREHPPLQGRSLWPLLRGESLPPRPALLELNADGRDYAALRTRELKVLDFGAARTGGFDLRRDADEKHGLKPQEDPRIKAALGELTRIRSSARELHELLGARSRSIEVDAQMSERLRELGY